MRMYRATKAANRPFPQLDEDDVIDYLIVEALATKAATEEEKQRKQAKLDAWKKDKSGLRTL
jgi:hypothetical protein